MTISLKADASGNFGSILINGTEAVRVNPGGIPASSTAFTPSGNIAANNVQAAIQELDTETQSGLATKLSLNAGTPFMTNKLINGEVTRINQRQVANWGSVANGNYGYDRWKKVDASNMTQIIEAGGFRPSTIHTLSGIGVTTQQITSPASGNWTLPNIPIGATNVQLEEGSVATPFEVRPIGFELGLCQRYYQIIDQPLACHVYSASLAYAALTFQVPMRATPGLSAPVGTTPGSMTVNGGGIATVTSVSLGAATANGAYILLAAAGVIQGDASLWINYLTGFSAEL